ncbi:hypothetical protein F442_14223, partial [Phytophthora nicotianae P10297]
MSPIEPCLAMLRHREPLAQVRDLLMDALNSSAELTARCGKRGHPCLFVYRGCGEIHDAGKWQMEEFYNLIRQWTLAWLEARTSRAFQALHLCIRREEIESLRKPGDFARVDTVMALELLPGVMRGYWKYHAPTDLLLNSGAEVSILDAAFAHKVGFYVDESQQQECVSIGEGVYVTKGHTKIKVTLAGSLVYFFDVWVGEMSGQDAILGMDFMVPAGFRLGLADGTSCLPDEIRIQLSAA